MSNHALITNHLIKFVRDLYQTNDFIPLHSPLFVGQESEYVAQTISSTFVSSVGFFVDQFEESMATLTGSNRAIAVVNGTAALQVGLHLVDVKQGDLVITQALSFVATCNAISHCGAQPVFCDVDLSTMGLSPESVALWLFENAYIDDVGKARRSSDDARIQACVPMHTFGHPIRIHELQQICQKWGITIVEDAAESVGSLYQGQHTGTFGQVGIQSFNGNKIITTGGGGMILTDEWKGAQAKHLTTTAKVAHAWNFDHDAVAWNFRMPNLNAALGLAQLEQLGLFLKVKRHIFDSYTAALSNIIEIQKEPKHCVSNFWLNAVICEDKNMRDVILRETNAAGVMTRPIWTLLSQLPMYSNCDSGPLDVSQWLVDRVVNVPSGVTEGMSK